MHTILSLLLLVAASDVAEKQQALNVQLRALEKEIAGVRGLQFKTPVPAKIMARPKDADPKAQGYYSGKQKTLFLYDDVKSYRSDVLIHLLVLALQDQHFDLAKLKKEAEDDDARLTLDAFLEGDATFTLVEVLKEKQPRFSAMILNEPLEDAEDLDRAFIHKQGARYVRALKDKGGWKAVDSAYRFPPSSTATILHLQRVPHINLGLGKTVGELGMIKLLRGSSATTADAFAAAAGWCGDDQREYKDGVVWQIAFANDKQAETFCAALVRMEDSREGARRIEGGIIWKQADGTMTSVWRRGTRVLKVQQAANEEALRRLRDRIEGAPQITVFDTQAKRTIAFGELLERLREAELICVGEEHDSDLHHRAQHYLIKALFARDERLGVGMEMFQRPFQKIVDEYLAGSIGEAEFLKGTEYAKRWGFDWSLYRPIVEFCQRNRVPLAALNAPQELTRQISKVGVAGLKAEEREQLAGIDFHVKEHREHWYERLSSMHGQTDAKPEQKERSYQVMTVWDGYMAASAAAFQQALGLRRLVIIAGSGHIERGFGIPNRAALRTGGRAVTIGVQPGEFAEPREAHTDFVLFVD